MGTTVDLGPPLWVAWGQAVAGLVAAALALVVVDDRAGQVLLLPGALLVLSYGVRDLVLRPVLSLQAGGLVVVVDGWHRVAVPWPELAGARVVTDRRTPLLELDLGDTVVVLSRRRLGCPPADALEHLDALRH